MATFGTAYKGMTEAGSARLIMDLFGEKMGIDDGRTIYPHAINDYDVGSYTPEKGIKISHCLRGGTAIPGPYLRVIEAHERGHAQGADEAAAMLYELQADPAIAMRIWSWRAAFVEAGERTKDADIFRQAEARYRGTKLEPVLAAVKEKGKELVRSGEYARFRAYESGISPASVNMN